MNNCLFLVPLEELFSNGKRGGAISIWISEFSEFYPNNFVLSNRKIGRFSLIRFKYIKLFRVIFLIPLLRRIANQLFIRLHLSEINKFDKVIIHNSFHYIKYLPQKSKIYLHFHNDYSKIMKYADREIINNRVSKVFVCSNFLKEVFLNIDIKTTVIYNGVNLDKFKIIESNHRDGVVYLGRIDYNKNLYGALRFLFEFCLKNNKSLNFSIIGKPALSIQSIFYYIKCRLYSVYIIKNSLLNVYFLGSMKHNLLYKYLNSSKVIISLPINDEAFGLNIVEAQLCGCIPLVNNLGGIHENNFYLKYYTNNHVLDNLLNLFLSDFKYTDSEIIKFSKIYDWSLISKLYSEIIADV